MRISDYLEAAIDKIKHEHLTGIGEPIAAIKEAAREASRLGKPLPPPLPNQIHGALEDLWMEMLDRQREVQDAWRQLRLALRD